MILLLSKANVKLLEEGGSLSLLSIPLDRDNEPYKLFLRAFKQLFMLSLVSLVG